MRATTGRRPSSALVRVLINVAIARLLEEMLAVADAHPAPVRAAHRKASLPFQVALLVRSSSCTWTPQQIADALEADRIRVSVILARLATAGEIERVERGVYQAKPIAREVA